MKYLLIIIFLLLGNQVFSKEMYVPESGEIVFEIIRKNKTIGTHTISFIENDKDLKVDIEVNINVKLGFLTIYKYRHNNTEYWKEGELIKISTNKNPMFKFQAYQFLLMTLLISLYSPLLPAFYYQLF